LNFAGPSRGHRRQTAARFLNLFVNAVADDFSLADPILPAKGFQIRGAFLT
jgi:hypothetical protein